MTLFQSPSPFLVSKISASSLLLLLLLFVTSVVTEEAHECTTAAADGTTTCVNPAEAAIKVAELDCGIYMAPSTLGDFTNLGMYTAKVRHEGEVLPYPEIAIPLLFRNWDTHPSFAFGDGSLWDRYIWEGEVANLESFDEKNLANHQSVFVPGLGCTVNSLLQLNNIRSTQGSTYDTATVPRSHPAAGAFTPYHSAKTKAVREIPVGSELFASYGDSWIPWIPDAAITKHKYLQAANELLEEFADFCTDLRKRYPEEQLSKETLSKLYQKLIKGFPHPSKEFSVLPKELDMDELLLSRNVPDTADYWRQKGVVSLEFLKEHGKCQDHMRPGLSTIPHAGRGAFATRDLSKGSVVGYAPLIHVGERAQELIRIPYNHSSEEYAKPDLVLNYSFGHKESTLLLTPYGAMVNYINHSKDKANVKVVWPTKEMVANKPEWLHENVEFLRDTTNKIGLSFDYVALRDIQEGEEILMDYGDDWQHAWDDHVAQWTPPVDAEQYVHSTNYQHQVHQVDNHSPLLLLKTPSERLANPYPPNLHTLCAASYRKDNDNNNDGGQKYVFVPVLRKNEERVPCDVLVRYVGDDAQHYTVKLHLESGETITVEQVTRPQGIDLYDKVFSQDWHLPQAFRHQLYIPEEIFPKNWKNLKT